MTTPYFTVLDIWPMCRMTWQVIW